MRATSGRSTIVCYGVGFDRGILYAEAERYQFAMPSWGWQCLMERYACYVGAWHDYWGNYSYQRLPGKDGTALGNARAALALVERLASHAAVPQ